MATTTNYGWTTPDDTALVKDGASAIRSLGTSVDTTTKNLNPSTTLGDIEYRSSTANTNTRLGIGTTGQVLAVSGGVPAWTTISSGGMTLLGTINLATTSSITGISGSYNRLFLNCYGVQGSAFAIRPNASSTSCTGLAHENANGAVQSDAYNGQSIQTRNSWNSSQSGSVSVSIDNYADTTSVKPFHLFGWYVNSAGA